MNGFKTDYSTSRYRHIITRTVSSILCNMNYSILLPILMLMMIGIILVIIAGVFSCVLASKGMNYLLLIKVFSVFK
jgi:hypothetical protein